MENVSPLPRALPQVAFNRIELDRILSLYGRMVAAGHWRDYALDLGARTASFSAFRRTAENPEIRIVKDPSLRLKQGEWVLYGEGGVILKRGHDLAGVLAPIERRLVKLVEA
ncbi:DUF2794 domain-containing protein [Polymorphobacter fuscus]|uniref:DUF2794 domain-containing protein n=1 Tax=Sandarakinorhabdus fusca TaxID=1439888 RepID=A0A7C9KWN0_9SPHN|nr:DUF2794 domain-containing protein [Polymorphobacter fuscus]KAB7648597.1 DUF2794 domain-containing protein [Polymorphobacter fuscus]MQT16146.1 DUF2794 domain-containing protein [Polymorphobacter fuscus]NJC07575.1 hypothetical protein [Polymorphobacter fuscus]